MTSKDQQRNASPACSASEAPDAYAGFLDKRELLAFLNEMLEAERAGAKVTAVTSTQAASADLATLMRDVQKDEAHWCAMLLSWIAKLEGEASVRTGDFYEKCVALSDIPARIALINRGQGWVVRKLREVLPKVRDDALHADLRRMLDSHEVNISRANEALAKAGSA